MTNKEALKLAILEYEKDLEFDKNNQWVKDVLKGLKECQQDLDQLEEHRKIEKELGIDLIILFNALKNGVWYFDIDDQLIHDYVWLEDNSVYSGHRDKLSFSIRSAYEEALLFFKDYGKTWSLDKKDFMKKEN